LRVDVRIRGASESIFPVQIWFNSTIYDVQFTDLYYLLTVLFLLIYSIIELNVRQVRSNLEKMKTELAYSISCNDSRFLLMLHAESHLGLYIVK